MFVEEISSKYYWRSPQIETDVMIYYIYSGFNTMTIGSGSPEAVAVTSLIEEHLCEDWQYLRIHVFSDGMRQALWIYEPLQH